MDIPILITIFGDVTKGLDPRSTLDKGKEFLTLQQFTDKRYAPKLN
jgi:hypothetical protein